MSSMTDLPNIGDLPEVKRWEGDVSLSEMRQHLDKTVRLACQSALFFTTVPAGPGVRRAQAEPKWRAQGRRCIAPKGEAAAIREERRE